MPDVDPDTVSLRILRTSDARQFAMAFPRSALISTVAKKVADTEGSPAQARVRLFFGGRVLLEEHDLRHYNISNDDVLHAHLVDPQLLPDGGAVRRAASDAEPARTTSGFSNQGGGNGRLFGDASGLDMAELPRDLPFRILPASPLAMTWYVLMCSETEGIHFSFVSLLALVSLTLLYLHMIMPSVLHLLHRLLSLPPPPRRSHNRAPSSSADARASPTRTPSSAATQSARAGAGREAGGGARGGGGGAGEEEEWAGQACDWVLWCAAAAVAIACLST